MSMRVLTILQFTGAFAAYLFMTALLPAMIFYRKVKGQRLAVRFLIYGTIGNFYMMNLVFVLELLHISNRFTLTAFTVLPALAAMVKINRIPVRSILEQKMDYIGRTAKGTMGKKELLLRIVTWLWKRICGMFRHLWEMVKGHTTEWLLVAGLTVLILWIYGTNLVTVFGYCASDMPVHNYWINYLGKNDIFVAGVYPFGFHCVIYYLHEVFGMETYVLLRVFCLVQTLMIHYVLLAFLKTCCKSRFVPYLATLLYAGLSFFRTITYSRYYSSLPQEFGMLFILPSVYFLCAFFRSKHEELEGKSRGPKAEWYLAGFALSFSMTLAVHFYNTMVAGLFCVGIAIGYAFRLFRKKYFGRVMAAGLLSIIIAVLPMGIAFATGTQLQGSLNWGMNIISGKGQEEQGQETQGTQEQTQEQSPGETGAEGEPTGTLAQGTESRQDEKKPGFEELKEKVAQKIQFVYNSIDEAVELYIFPDAPSWFRFGVYGGMGLLLLLGIIFLIVKKRDYGAILITVSFTMGFLSLLMAAGAVGLPKLMDETRCSIYFAFTVPLLLGMCLDGALYLVLGWTRKQRLMQAVSFLCLAMGVGAAAQNGWIKEPGILDGLQSNSAVTCLTNILLDNPDFTWTICSANDELRMAEDYGYHYETIEFLKEVENYGARGKIIIPTRKVYFFIEKIPLDYTEPYEGSGQEVSKEGAARKLPAGSGLGVYKGENRWVVMSKMYYWAQEFQKLYPNEMKVYFENEDFICYSIEQNDYRPYNFAIDYRYNLPAGETE